MVELGGGEEVRGADGETILDLREGLTAPLSEAGRGKASRSHCPQLLSCSLSPDHQEAPPQREK